MVVQDILRYMRLIEEGYNMASITLKNMNPVFKFIKKFNAINTVKIGPRELAGKIDQLRQPLVRRAIAGRGPDDEEGELAYKKDRSQRLSVDAPKRSPQARAYGFADRDLDRDIILGDDEIEVLKSVADALSVIRAYDKDERKITDLDILSLISAFLGDVKTSSLRMLSNKPFFVKHAEAFLFNRQKTLADGSETSPVIESAKKLDLNAFIFLISIRRRQSRTKESWDRYINPTSLKIAKTNILKGQDLDYEDAGNSLVDAGFVEIEDGYHLPNWENIKTFQEKFISTLVAAVQHASEVGIRAIRDMNDMTRLAGRGLSKKEKALQNLLRTIEELTPVEFYNTAKRSIIAAMKNEVSDERTEMRALVNNYLYRGGSSDRDLDETSPIARLIENTIKLSSVKYTAKLLLAMSKGSEPITAEEIVKHDITPLLRNIGKSIKNP